MTSLAIAIWVTVYTLQLYPQGDDVLVGSGEKAPEGEPEKNYEKTSKQQFIIEQGLVAYFGIVLYPFFYFQVRMFVNYNKDYEYSKWNSMKIKNWFTTLNWMMLNVFKQ